MTDRTPSTVSGKGSDSLESVSSLGNLTVHFHMQKAAIGSRPGTMNPLSINEVLETNLQWY